MESGLLLNVVVTQGTTVLELLSGKDETLLIRGNSFLVLDLGLDVIDGIRGLDLKSDGLASDCKERRTLVMSRLHISRSGEMEMAAFGAG